MLFTLISCKKEKIPVLSTTAISDISATSAKSGGNISDDKGATVTKRGVCWSTDKNPTIQNDKTEDGSGAGSFVSLIFGLEPHTTYYVRAYATNSAARLMEVPCRLQKMAEVEAVLPTRVMAMFTKQ